MNRSMVRYSAIGIALTALCTAGFIVAANKATRALRHALAAPSAMATQVAVASPSSVEPTQAGAPPQPIVPMTSEQELLARHLTLPVAGVKRDALSSASFHEGRPDHPHEALDIMAARGTPVVAVEDGRIEKLFWSKAGGHTIYQFDPSRRFAYYYAHLDRYADGLTEGLAIHRGDTIGFVGSTGNANPNAPHLHFAIFLLTPERQWWKGTAIDPYPILSAQ